eukprot:gene4136-5890_t
MYAKYAPTSFGSIDELLNEDGSIQPAGGRYYGGDRMRNESIRKLCRNAILGLFILQLVSIIVLFAVVFTIKQDYSKVYSTNQVSSNLYISNSISSGSIVSLSNSGSVQIGGGTSIYLNTTSIELNICPSNNNMIPLFNNTFLTTVTDKLTSTSIIQLIVVNANKPNQGKVIFTYNANYNIYEIIVLSQNSGSFIIICADNNDAEETAYIVSGYIQSNENMNNIAIILGTPVKYVDTYSINPGIVSLSATSFAISYYDYSDSSVLMTRFGYVDSYTTVTLSQPTQYLTNYNYSIYTTIASVSDSQYLLLYHDSLENNDDLIPNSLTSQYYGKYGPLSVILVTLPTSKSINDDLIIANSTILYGSNALYSLTATQLNNGTIVVAYTDAANNYGITTQIITIEAIDDVSSVTQNYAILFGSSWHVTSGQTTIPLSGGLMDIDIAKASDDLSFVILYSDVSNHGAVTVSSGQLTVSGELIQSAPDYVLSIPPKPVGDYYVSGAIAALSTASLNNQVGFFISMVKNCSIHSVSLSFMETKPSPYGIVANRKILHRTTGSLANVIISGSAVISTNKNTALNVGMIYYTNTMGQLIPSGIYAGNECYGISSTSQACSSDFYIYNNDNNQEYGSGNSMILSYNSRVGIAIDSVTLLLST